MVQGACGCCGSTSHLREVLIVPRGRSPLPERSVTLCLVCKDAMAFDMDALVRRVDSTVPPSSFDDALIEGFISRYVEEVWPNDSPPTYQELCDIMNAAGISTPRGGRWQYHNCMQKLKALNVDVAAMCAGRAKASYAERLRALVDRAAEWTNNSMPYARRAQEPLDRDWAPTDPMAMPDDMPGLGAKEAEVAHN